MERPIAALAADALSRMDPDTSPNHQSDGPVLTDLEHRIQTIISREFPQAATSGTNLAAHTPILGKGFLDSVQALSLVIALEAEFGIEFDDDELAVEHFANLRALADHVRRKMPRATPPEGQ